MSNVAFTPAGVHNVLRDDAGPPLSLTQVVKYARLLFHSRVLVPEPGQEGVLFRERRMRLGADVDSPDTLVVAYETGVVMRLISSADSPVDASDVATVLELDTGDDGHLDYCERVIVNAQDLAQSIATTRTGPPITPDP